MDIGLKNAIFDLIENEKEIRLSTGENEYYMENDKYSVTIEYSLYDSGLYSEPDSISLNGYSFKILSIFLIDNKDNSEYELEPDADIEYAMLVDSDIDDWTDDLDSVVENYLNNKE